MTLLGLLGAIAAVALIAVVFVDTFEVMLLPRRVRHAYRPARLYYRAAWIVWRKAAMPRIRWQMAERAPRRLRALRCSCSSVSGPPA